MSDRTLDERLLQLHEAVSDFARTLLSPGPDRLEPGLRILLEAAGADAVAVQREVLDDSGLPVVSEARVDRRTPCDGPLVEARIPVRVGARLGGELVFAGVDRAWTTDEIDVLGRAGEVLGAAWERHDIEESERSRSAALTMARDLEVRTARAFRNCARTLLIGDDEPDGRRAIESLRSSLRAAVAYVDPVAGVTQPDGDVVIGLVAASPEARAIGVPLWLQTMPWAEIPGPNRRLAAGETVIVGTPESIGRRAGNGPGARPMVKAEMAVPIMRNGAWIATLGVADVVERFWTADQRAMAEAVADLFAAFFERRRRMEAIRRGA